MAAPPRGVRPTSDRLREALFSSLGADVEGSTWLDLFAGSGAVGIEALSRGAARVVMIDREASALQVIRRNLLRCGIATGFEDYQEEAFAFLRRHEPAPVRYIFLDPPYRFDRYEALLALILKTGWLAPRGRILLEVFKKTPLDFLGDWRLVRRLRAGDSHLLILELDGAASSAEGVSCVGRSRVPP